MAKLRDLIVRKAKDDDELMAQLSQPSRPKVNVQQDFGGRLKTAALGALEEAARPIQKISSNIEDILAGEIARQRQARTLRQQEAPITPFQRQQFRRQSIGTSFEQLKDVGDIAKQAAVTGIRAVGATQPATAAAFGLFNTAVGTAGGLLKGQDLPQAVQTGALGAVESAPRTLGMVGVNRFTQPFMNQQISQIMSKYPGLSGQIRGRAASAGLNVGEGLLMDIASDLPTTPQSIALDAITGGTLFAGPANEPIRQAFRNIEFPRIGESGFARVGRPEQVSPLQIDPESTPLLRDMVRTGRARLDTATGLVKTFEGGDEGWVNIGRLPKSTVEDLQFRNQIPDKIKPGFGEAGVIKPDEFIGKKNAFNINKEKLGLGEQEAEKLDETVEMIRPLLEKNKGDTLTHAEILEGGRKAALMDEVMTRADSKAFAEKIQSTRNFIKKESGEQGLSKEYIQQLEVLSSQASDAGRRLNAFSVGAEDVGIKEKMIRELLKLGTDADEMAAAAKNVDWKNKNQVTEFYRQFNPAKLTDYLDEFRYTNMLSSPNTHIVNAFSNFVQTGVVAPIEKTIVGTLDWAKSSLTGSEREYFARQGADYAAAYWKNLPEAFTAFKNTVKGIEDFHKPELDFVPTSTSKLTQAYTMPLRALEAGDQFFRKMTEAGELASLKRVGIEGAQAQKLAADSAEYRLFRQGFDPEGRLGQGGLLKVWDQWNSAVGNLRSKPGGKWIIPFLQTPTNILKQGIEYSPLGVATIPGSREPMQQLGKALIGSSVFAAAYSMAEGGLSTWDAPTSAKEREAFYAAGLQPYSLKIGDKWVSYSKLGPLSYPIAMAAALKWAEDNGVEGDTIGNLGRAASGTLGFFADQSYVRGIGDIIDAIKGDEFKQGRALANIPAQMVPYRSFLGWITRLVDPVYRKTTGGTVTEQMMKSLKSQIPGVSQTLEPYTDPLGQPSLRQFPGFNAFSPLKVTEEKEQFKDLFEASQTESARKRSIKFAKESGDISGVGDIGLLDEARKAQLPTDMNTLTDLYKDRSAEVKRLERSIRMLPFESGTEIEKQIKQKELQEKLDAANLFIDRVESERPEQFFEVQLGTFKSGGGQVVEARANWAKEQLDQVKTGEEAQELINRLWDEKVLTGTSKGVAAALEKMGYNVWEYTGDNPELKKATDGKKPKTIKFKSVTAPKVKSAAKTIKIKTPPSAPKINVERIARAAEFDVPEFRSGGKIKLTSRRI